MTSGRSDASQGVEDFVKMLGSLRPTQGEERDAVTLWPERLHAARNAENCIELFLEGSRESFSQSAIGRGLEAGQYRDSKTGREFSAVVIRSGPAATWLRPMAHLAYEAVQVILSDPQVGNGELLDAIAPYLGLVVDRDVLSIEHQLGLVGELIFLRELLNACGALGLSSRRALECWKGWDAASRDFSRGTVAVEVKTTAGVARHHWVHPMYQLLPGNSDERVFVYSVGVRVDRSREYKLTSAVRRILDGLTEDLRGEFEQQLEKYLGKGFAFAQWRQYELEPGFFVALAPSLFRVDHLSDILRPESFEQHAPPGRMIDARYLVTLEGLSPIGQTEREAVLTDLLGGH